jgi:DNA-directed RNA polymerase
VTYLQDITQQQWRALLDREQERESLALAEGERRFRQQVQKASEQGELSRSDVARKLLQEGIEPLERAITDWLAQLKEARKGRGGVRHVAVKWIERIGVPVAAYMTLKVVLDGITKRREYTTICCEISDLIRDELRYRRLQEKAPGLFDYKLKQFRTSSYAHMARSMDHAVRTARDEEGKLLETADLQMTPQQRANVGAKLVELLTASTSLVEPVMHKTTNAHGKQKTTLYLEAAPETSEWLTKRTDVLALLQAQNLPMVVPPLQWAPGKRGGFRYALRGKYPLVRGVFDKVLRISLENSEMPLVYVALNSLQNTAWRINAAVLKLVRDIEQRGGGLAGIPLTEPLDEPVRPFDIDTNEEARKQWRKAAGNVKDQNHLRKMRGREIQRVLDTAAGVVHEEAIFFPYSLDFRGRIYPIADYLHPQGNDLAKALLVFAQGKVVDVRAAQWLAVHGANCLGETPEGKVSKMTIAERIEWVHQHTQQIITVADDPFAATWWAQADDPIQFFAFCVEWRNLIRANDRDEEYVSCLPVSMDGSCNGLQHFAAMLRDEVGGEAVNVIPQTRPQDIYQRIADTILDKLEGLAPTDPLAAKLLGSGLVTRKLTKRPTMTFGYGSRRFGFKQQLKDYLRGLDNWHEVKHLLTVTEEGKDKSQINAACSLLAQLIWEALGEVVVKAAEGMKWMQNCARGIVTAEKHVEWTVPVTGFRVRQEYIQWKVQQIRTVLAGRIVRPRVHIATDAIDPVKQANAISPNVVHSLDAAALMLTVSQAAAEGVEAFAMVHDSYGTLAADCEVLARCCRQSFVRLYTMQDVVWSLYQQFAAQYEDPTKCPEPPAKGEMDVNGVLASEYFFA